MSPARNVLKSVAAVGGRLLAFATVSAVIGALLVGFLAPLVAATDAATKGSVEFFDSLPEELTINPPGQVSKIVAADGSPIATVFSENRQDVTLKQVAPDMRNALVAVEDYRYYEHGGIDPMGIMRALVSNASGGRQGASTLTQQYVTNVLNDSRTARGDAADVVLNGQKTTGDKLREMKLALGLEKRLSKDQILQGYLNIVAFSGNAYGVQAASQYFFSVDAAKLSLPQAALLAGLVNGPGYYDPIAHPDRAVERRNLVLDAMLKHGYITAKKHDAAVKTPLKLAVKQPRQGCAYAAQSPYFCDYVLHQFLNDPAYGATPDERLKLLQRGGLTIRTTLDPRLQGPAQRQVDATTGANPDKWGASLVTIQPGTGKVVAMAQNSRMLAKQGSGFVTAYNFNVDKTDDAGQALGGVGGMQPGSTMKPVTLAAWLGEGKSPDQTVDAARRVYPLNFPWKSTCGPVAGAYNSREMDKGAAPDLQNDTPGFYRPMTVRMGIYYSINTATFASAAGLNDFCDIQRAADALGMHDGAGKGQKLQLNTLGNLLGGANVAPLTMANAFATFASNGTYCTPISITRVEDGKGKRLGGQSPSCRAGAITPEVAKRATNVLQDVLSKGSGLLIPDKVTAPAAAKTGTNQYNNQTWIVGYTRGLATASFFGDPFNASESRPGTNVTINGRTYPAVDGADIAGPQWARYMQAVYGLYAHGPFDPPTLPQKAAPKKAEQKKPDTAKKAKPRR
ncbi:transglycosylase domain-containing protein [Arthrobacter sp. Y-9]|uniref:transglycosylase domain-containing protein n=1 Tax=Arthrobacter sp. Y-9 TaxID=3039385 RepID=UPI00241EEC59|nr:transglycosylase domain-containing protein [Arthrobacter sp. Y-9]WFR83070.1 transglycosylase domain-containing protein [Arthrobacter sp. Y-9]